MKIQIDNEKGGFRFAIKASNGHWMARSIFYESKVKLYSDLYCLLGHFQKNQKLLYIKKRRNSSSYYDFYNRYNKFVAYTKKYYSSIRAQEAFFIVNEVMAKANIVDTTI